MDIEELTPETEAILVDSAAEQDEAERELEILKAHIAIELEAELCDLAYGKNNWLNEIQPPASIIHAAAVAATEVFMAFERGYRMG